MWKAIKSFKNKRDKGDTILGVSVANLSLLAMNILTIKLFQSEAPSQPSIEGYEAGAIVYSTISFTLLALLAIYIRIGIIDSAHPKVKYLGIFYILKIFVIGQFLILQNLIFAVIAINLGIETQDTIDSKWDYLYFSIVTFTTLGYGDFIPSPELRMWAAAHALLGYAYMALFIGIILKTSFTQSKK